MFIFKYILADDRRYKISDITNFVIALHKKGERTSKHIYLYMQQSSNEA